LEGARGLVGGLAVGERGAGGSVCSSTMSLTWMLDVVCCARGTWSEAG
jgi:hypothetical protein